MLKFKGIDKEGKEVVGCGVGELDNDVWVIFVEKMYEVVLFEEEIGAALYVEVEKESIEIIR